MSTAEHGIKQEVKVEEDEATQDEQPCAASTSTGRQSSRSSRFERRTTAASGASRDDVDQQRKPRQTFTYYKRTREEALNCVKHGLPDYEIFDMTTGFMKEKYRALRSPSPPTGTTVFEVGTGRPYTYVSGTAAERLFPGSEAFESAKDAKRLAEQQQTERKRQMMHEAAASTSTESRAKQRKTQTPRPSEHGVVVKSEPDESGEEARRRQDRPHVEGVVGGSGGLTRVIPLPLHRPVESPATATTRRRGRGTVNTDRCDCIALVTANSFHLHVYRPDIENPATPGEVNTVLAESPTLRHLYRGYRNYVENDLSADVHALTAYLCRSSRSKLFSVYKTISCGLQTSDPPPPPQFSDDTYPASLVAINQYLSVFSALTNFNYTWLLPALKSGLCNVMVVDKRWTYSPARQVYLPCYRLLANDNYTDLVVRGFQRINNRGTRIRNVRFLSTTDTVLYTNRRALESAGNDTDTDHLDTDTDTRTPPHRGVDSHPTVVTLPPKKRMSRLDRNLLRHKYPDVGTARQESIAGVGGGSGGGGDHGPHDATTTASLASEPAPSTSTAGQFAGLEEKDPTVYRQIVEPSNAMTSVQEEEDDDDDDDYYGDRVMNPTLVVFRHIVESHEPNTLLCNIMMEINLGDRLRH